MSATMDADPDLSAARAVRRATQRLSRRLQLQRATDGLSLTKISMLGHLARKGPMAAGALAAADRLQPQSVTRVLAELEADGHIEQLEHVEDKRRRVFSITDPGRAALRQDMRMRDEWLASVMHDALTPDERDALLRAAAILERLADAD
ncbi:MarR family winged helix-turn-helix transcriptional regulator [Dactylosporangium sp. NPDC051541]|uniref:MarR family winged helix-turn-helix transcriptional regulator n=1 Tax=Dactylosporangium sp. NPDC051541 TaxID=3363977 RepID=UPI0037BAA895